MSPKPQTSWGPTSGAADPFLSSSSAYSHDWVPHRRVTLLLPSWNIRWNGGLRISVNQLLQTELRLSSHHQWWLNSRNSILNKSTNYQDPLNNGIIWYSSDSTINIQLFTQKWCLFPVSPIADEFIHVVSFRRGCPILSFAVTQHSSCTAALPRHGRSASRPAHNSRKNCLQ